MLYHDRIDRSKGIDPAESNNSKECISCHYWVFNKEFKYQNSACNGCHGFTILCVNISDIAIITVKGVDYHYIIYGLSKSDLIHLLKMSVLDDHGYI